ncbi:hypothetical protein JXA27_01555 [Aerococcaceae bacterium zg-B36]|uniref:hypothetical protein n=1 Tax=Aerococcaceae bacterium zg-252 TaxID=2796928 RepID=UPI001BD815D0|nr:hypothetical protein [Aerococcaceae bacterium zg-B36]
MKKLLILAMILCMGWLNIVPALAIDVNTESTTNLETLVNGLKSLQEVPSYRVQMTIMNQRSHEKNAIITMDVNQETGDMRLIFDFYNRKANPKNQHFELYAYHHFSEVYTTALGWLQSMQYFKLPFFNQDTHAIMAPYREMFIPIDDIDGQTLVQNLNYVALLLPNLSRLLEADERDVYELNNTYFLNLHRIDIPEYLFKNNLYLGMHYNVDMSMDEQSAQLTQRLKLMPIESGLSYTMSLTNQLSPTYLATIDGLDNKRDLPNLEQEQVIETAGVTDKLIDFKLVYNHNNQMYKLTLNGITENVDLNIFNNQTADFRTYEFQIDYVFRPLEWQMPESNELKILSQKELSKIMNQLIEQEDVNE